MSGLSRAVGDSPRVRLLEALIRLGEIEVTPSQLAVEAGCYRMSTNRVLPELVRDGLVARRRAGERFVYSAMTSDPTFRVLAHTEAALDQIDMLKEASVVEASTAASEAIVEARRLVPRLISSSTYSMGSSGTFALA